MGIIPVLFGRGLRFFDNESVGKIKLEQTSILESPSRIDLKYRIIK